MPASPYHQRLYRARHELDAGPRADVLRAVAEHYADLIADLAGQTMNVDGIEVSRGPLTPDDADRIVRALRDALRRLTDRLAGAIDREAQAAIELAVTAAEEAAASIVKPGSGLLVHADFAAVPERAVEGLFVRRGLDDGYTYAALLRRGAARAQPLFEGLVARAVTTGQTGDELTRDLAAALADVDPLVRTAARRATGANGRLLKRALLREARLDPNPDVLPAARRLWYEARRVAVTEVNVAFAEADRAASAVSPVVDLLRWRVSGRHDGLKTGACSCDFYRTADLHGYGPGLYHPRAYPALPHPHCACRAEHVLRPASDWGTPKRPLPERVGAYDPAARAQAERDRGQPFGDAQWARVSGAGRERALLALRAARKV